MSETITISRQTAQFLLQVMSTTRFEVTGNDLAVLTSHYNTAAAELQAGAQPLNDLDTCEPTNLDVPAQD